MGIFTKHMAAIESQPAINGKPTDLLIDERPAPTPLDIAMNDINGGGDSNMAQFSNDEG